MAFYFSCCGAGTAADTEYVTQLISSHIKLHSLSTGRQVISEAVKGAVSRKKKFQHFNSSNHHQTEWNTKITAQNMERKWL